jgi:inosine-uridine nucleoside N-ribohydrolase
MTFPIISEAQRLALLAPPSGRAPMVLDTDTYNEIDDQFALVHALLSPERLDVQAIYAAPFHNDRSSGPADGMRRSLEEIERVLTRLGRTGDAVFPGSEAWLPADGGPVPSAAVDDLVARALAPREGPLYVVAIGAITNIASAILQAPEIIERIVVVWLGGNPTYWHHTWEFNLMQDVPAAQLVFNCGVPLVRVPCVNVAEHIKTTQAELAAFLKGSGAVGAYLYEIFSAYSDEHYARSKEIWDLGPIAWLLDPSWADTALIHSPVLNHERNWSFDPHRHFIREVYRLDRDKIFRDLFQKIEHAARTSHTTN